MRRLGYLFPYLPKQPGHNKRMRALAPQIVKLLNTIAGTWHRPLCELTSDRETPSRESCLRSRASCG